MYYKIDKYFHHIVIKVYMFQYNLDDVIMSVSTSRQSEKLQDFTKAFYKCSNIIMMLEKSRTKLVQGNSGFPC